MAASREDTSPKGISSTSAIAVTPATTVLVANLTFAAANPSSARATAGANTPTVVFPAITIVARRFLPAAVFSNSSFGVGHKTESWPRREPFKEP